MSVISPVVAIILAVVVTLATAAAVPTDHLEIDLTGTPFSSACGSAGTFTSGKLFLSSRSGCKLTDVTSDCFFNSRLVMAGAKVLFDDGSTGVITEVFNQRRSSSFDFSTFEFTSTTNLNLRAQVLKAGEGSVESFKGNLKCTSINGVTDCKASTFEEVCS